MIIILMSTVCALAISPEVLLDDIREHEPRLERCTSSRSFLLHSSLSLFLSVEINVHSIALSNRLESFVSENLPEGNVCLTLNLYPCMGRGIERQ